MRMKTKTLDRSMSIESQNNNPGSGAYENPEALSARGKYTVSKHRGTGATLFNPKSSKRFFELSIHKLIKKSKFLVQAPIEILILFQIEATTPFPKR